MILALALLPLTAQAASYTWTGTTSNAWNLSTNWTGGTFPQTYADTATIPSSATHYPVSLSTTELLGGLTTQNPSKTSATALDITSTGLLGMQGNVTIGSLRPITLEGVLRNDAASSSTTYTISGPLTLNGGTISSQNGGIWNITGATTGNGTVSAPITGSATFTANGGTLSLTGANSVVTGTLTSNTGATLSLGAITLNGGTLSTAGGAVNLNGTTLNGTTLSSTASNQQGTFTVTGNSTLKGAITRNYYDNFNILSGNTLSLNAVTYTGVTSYSSFTVNTGATLNNVSGNSSISGGGLISLQGGTLSNTGGGTFTTNSPISGFGNISGPLAAQGGITAKGGVLYVDGTAGTGVTSTSTSWGTDGVAGSVLDLKGNIAPVLLFAGTNGLIQLDGATLKGNINNNGLAGNGTINVTNDSTVNGAFYTGATLGINSGKQFNISGSTLGVTAASLNNGGTLAIGNGTLTTYATSAYALGGGGNITFAGGAISAYSTGSFTSNNALSGYGTISAPFTNNGTVTLTGGTSTVSGAFTNQSGATLNVQTNPATFGTVTNNGTVHVTGATVTFGNFTNNGVYKSDPSTQTFNTLSVGSGGYISASAGDIYKILGDFINNSTQSTSWNTSAAEVAFITGTSSDHTFDLAGVDDGQSLAGYTNNFALGTLDLTGQTLNLVDGNSTPGAALYVDDILGVLISGGTVTDITGNGFNIYYNANDNPYLQGETYALEKGGVLTPSTVPVPAALWLFGSGLAGIVARRRFKK